MQIQTTKHVCTMVTNHITTSLKQGIFTWRSLWNDAGIPRNVISQKAYRDINVCLLTSPGYVQNLFITEKELTSIGGRIQKGEKGYLIVFGKPQEMHAEIAKGEQAWGNDKTLMRYTEVFNIEQCDNVRATYIKPMSPRFGPMRICEHLLSDILHLPHIRHKEPDPYYNFKEDYINMPKLNAYNSVEAYYGVLFHELVHSTGHPKRLARIDVEEMTEYGGDIFSFEEIIAELGMCYLASYTGIAPIPIVNSLEYLMGWIKRLEQNHFLIVYAAYEAQRAVDYILRQDTSAAYQDAN